MDNEYFLYLINNQSKWADEYRRQNEIRKDIIKIISRKYRSKGENTEAEIKENFLKSYYIDEIEIIENPLGKGFQVRYFDELYLV